MKAIRFCLNEKHSTLDIHPAYVLAQRWANYVRIVGRTSHSDVGATCLQVQNRPMRR